MRYNYFSKFGVEPKPHHIEAILGAPAGERVEGHGSGDTGEVDVVQVRQDRATVHPRHQRLAVALDASRLVVEHLTAPERPPKHVRVEHQQRAQSVYDGVDRIHHQRHVHLYEHIIIISSSSLMSSLKLLTHTPETHSRNRRHRPKFDAIFRRQRR